MGRKCRLSKRCSQYDNIDIHSLCMNYAASVFGMSGLDDMVVSTKLIVNLLKWRCVNQQIS